MLNKEKMIKNCPELQNSGLVDFSCAIEFFNLFFTGEGFENLLVG
jgi:hypothetical protein